MAVRHLAMALTLFDIAALMITSSLSMVVSGRLMIKSRVSMMSS